MLLGMGAELEIANPHGVTPLMYAVLRDRLEVMRALLKAGADPNASDTNGETALFTCKSLHATQALIEHGAHVNVFASQSNGVSNVTPLITMAYQGRSEQVKCLLHHGAKANVKDSCNRSALSHAIDARWMGVIQLMLDEGVEPDGSALRACVAQPTLETHFIAILKNIPKTPKNLNGVDRSGRTALDIALKNGNKHYALQLLNCGAESKNESVKALAELFNSLYTDYRNVLAMFTDVLSKERRF
jgi:ankyrin repeat protein